MIISETALPGVLLVTPHLFKDRRGHFLETYHYQRYAEGGISDQFVQDNISHSVQNVLRGMHYQLGRPQGKLLMVTQGEIYDVVLDIRQGSATFGQWVGHNLSSGNYRQIYIPEGFAHGFCVLSESATVLYKCTDYYFPEEERGIRWNDPALAINWPVSDPILSEKDRSHPFLADLPADQLL